MFIVNKAGSMVFQKDFAERAGALTTNDLMSLASTLFSIQEIARNLSPVRDPTGAGFGIERLEADTFVLQAFRPATGTLFVVTAAPGTQNLKTLLAEVYQLFADFVLKNPFHQLDMPIRSNLFEEAVGRTVRRYAEHGAGHGARA